MATARAEPKAGSTATARCASARIACQRRSLDRVTACAIAASGALPHVSAGSNIGCLRRHATSDEQLRSQKPNRPPAAAQAGGSGPSGLWGHAPEGFEISRFRLALLRLV